MKLVIQRVLRASVKIEGKTIGKIDHGLLILLGIGKDDGEKDIRKMAEKVSKLRILSDKEGKMNKSILDTNGSILVVSQFTLLANTKKGNRPSFLDAGDPKHAYKLYILFVEELKRLKVKKVETGRFGQYMKVELINDGPVTIVI